ncbi:MAG TPA: DUF1178 family protein [Hyphomicrobiaceae bacterium]|nr:DUF1178 family protein [Hyphomicrobiaceae bacterium]
MIRYTLRCDKRHEFEGWFKSSDAFDRQAKRRLVECPKCGSTKVERSIMAPSIVKGRKSGRGRPAEPAPTTETAPPELAISPAPAPGEPDARQTRELLRQMRKVRDELLSKSEYVGPKFADEARKIHLKETPARGIHGEASKSDVEALREDGIEVYPVPVLPDDQN